MMNTPLTNTSAAPPPPLPEAANKAPPPSSWQETGQNIRLRLVEGLLVLLPILVTLWALRWLYLTLDNNVITPIAAWVIWKKLWLTGQETLPPWLENFVAPVLAVLIVVGILYWCGVMAHSQLRQSFDKLVMRVPLVSHIYEAVRNLIQCFDKPEGQPQAQRVVLVPFPHPGMRLPAIVTSSCRDVATNTALLCVYVPTTPIPTSGFFLMVPESEVTELNWNVQQTLQAIISGGLTAPSNVTYYGSDPTTAAAACARAESTGAAGLVTQPAANQPAAT